MIEITIPPLEGYDERKEEFVIIREEKTFTFEHSLVSLTKWEAKYKKPFLMDNNKTQEETLDYYKMMCLQDDFDNSYLTQDLVNQITNYLSDSQTATKITPRPKDNDANSRRIMTSEVLYAYMANAHIWKECEEWPLNKLITLLSVIGELNSPPEEIPKEEVIRRQRELNEERKRKYNTKG